MSTAQLDQILEDFAAATGAWSESTPLDVMRADLDGLFTRHEVASGTEIRPAQGAVPGEWVLAEGADTTRAMLLLHGGGFSMGSARAHRAYAAALSKACNLGVLTIDYRLAPEHLYPAAHEDSFRAWQELVAEGFEPEHIAICGDSAGGGMALSLANRLKGNEGQKPGALVLVSPWADMTASGQSYETADDPISSKDMALGMAAGYLGDADPRSPEASPIFGTFDELPPTLILAGSREVFLDDARAIADGIHNAGGIVQFDIWDGMIHQFPLHTGVLEEAMSAIDQIGAFVREALA